MPYAAVPKLRDPISQSPVDLPENFLLLQFCLGIGRISLREAAELPDTLNTAVFLCYFKIPSTGRRKKTEGDSAGIILKILIEKHKYFLFPCIPLLS